MDVSKNRGGPPKSPILIEVSIIFTIHFGGVYPYFWFNTHIFPITDSEAIHYQTFSSTHVPNRLLQTTVFPGEPNFRPHRLCFPRVPSVPVVSEQGVHLVGHLFLKGNHVSHGPKNPGSLILSMKYWLVNRDPYNGV